MNLETPHKSNDVEATFWEHFFALRRYLFICVLGIIFCGGIVHYYHQQIIAFIFRPLGDTTAIFLSPIDPFLFIFKIDFFGGLILALPLIIMCAFFFVAPALSTRRISWFIVFFISILMLTTGAIVYTFTLLLPLSLSFLLSIEVPGIESSFTAQNYLNFVLVQLYMSIAIALTPLVLVGGTLLRILNPHIVSGKRGIVYVGITIILAFLTPTTDLVTLTILLVPAIVIFECGILIAKLVYAIRSK